MKEKISTIKNKVGSGIKKTYELSLGKWLLFSFISSVILGLVLEMLGRRSLLSPFLFIFYNPLVFLYNILIIFFTLNISLLFKRRGFIMGLVTLIWVAVGVINFVVLGFRITPFSAIDFLMFSDVLSMFSIYFNLFQRILIFTGILIFIILIVIAFLKTPKLKGKVNYIQGIIVVLVSFALVYIATIFMVEFSLVSTKFTNLGTAYKDYGFVYCFSNSVIDQGVTKPEDYSFDAVNDLELELHELDAPKTKVKYKNNKPSKPDIIAIQLESFIDIGRVKGINTDIESIPNFKEYEAEYPSGFLTVPAIGAGTANTEFEILTGMKSKDFGAGEYPYKTVLTTTPCESMAQLLLRDGYGTHAIHNNKAKFYSRDVTYGNLGFQTFTSLEYMKDFERTETGWAKDSCLPDEIIAALDSDEEPDFVYTISVQGHGRYPTDALKTEEHVQVTLDNENEELQYQFGYFVNQCYEMDEMIKDLKDRLDERGDDYVLLLYGDHIPSLTFEEGQFISGTESQTEYVIISNYDLGLEDRDVYAYEMSDYILRALGYKTGVCQDVHQRFFNFDSPEDSEVFDQKIQLVEYDMLYGDKFIYNFIPEYTGVDIQLGLYPITTDDVEYISGTGSLKVTGSNFTPFSVVLLDETRLQTVYVDEHTLIVPKEELDGKPEGGNEICVAQIDKDKHELSRTNTIYFY